LGVYLTPTSLEWVWALERRTTDGARRSSKLRPVDYRNE